MKNGKLVFAKAKVTKLSVLSAIAVCVVFVSCGNKNSTANISRASGTTTTSNVIEQLKQNYDAEQNSANATSTQSNSQNGEATNAISENSLNRQLSNGDGIDVDLTQMSSTMVYAEVFNMMIEPESYVGKTIKMRGDFFVYKPVLSNGTQSEKNIYACVIADATACCQQGLEFELTGNKKNPDEYLDSGSEITVVGTFEMYEDVDYGFVSIRITNAELV